MTNLRVKNWGRRERQPTVLWVSHPIVQVLTVNIREKIILGFMGREEK